MIVYPSRDASTVPACTPATDDLLPEAARPVSSVNSPTVYVPLLATDVEDAGAAVVAAAPAVVVAVLEDFFDGLQAPATIRVPTATAVSFFVVVRNVVVLPWYGRVEVVSSRV